MFRCRSCYTVFCNIRAGTWLTQILRSPCKSTKILRQSCELSDYCRKDYLNDSTSHTGRGNAEVKLSKEHGVTVAEEF